MAEVLIVEDSPTQAEQLRFLLSEAGHEVTAATDGAHALDVMREWHPALVITDVVMPRMDGYTLCRAIKADPAMHAIPVILLTSLASPRDVVEGLACGADNFIRKPYEDDYLLARVTNILTNLELRKTQRSRMGLEIEFAGERHFITGERQQIVDFLISSFEEAVHLNGELTRSYRSLDSLYRLAEGLNRCTDERSVTDEALARVLELPGVRAAWILVREGWDGLRLAGARGEGLAPRETLARAAGDAGVPLITGDRDVGVMNLLGVDGMFDDDALRELQAVGSQVAAALERALLQENLERRVQERTLALTAEIAGRERAEEALRSLAAIVESSDDGIVRLTPGGVVTTWNPGAERLYGYRADEVVGRSVGTLVPGHEIDEMADILRRVARGESVQGYETVRTTKDGRATDVSLTLSPVRDAVGEVVAVAEIARDITAGKELERQLLQSQKMESVGRLAGGIAHDFNNLMTAVLGFSQLLLVNLEDDEVNRGFVEEIKRSGERATVLTKQLLAFARRQVQRPEVLDLNEVVAEMEPLLERLIGEDVSLRVHRSPDLWHVKVDRSHVDQVVMNLAINARDAMPEGGSLTIETTNAELSGGYTDVHLGVDPGHYVMLSVSDTGLGMDPDTQSHIFEPFFTTKEEGKGTGLGLSTVYGIVQQSGGSVRVYSEPGRGATFKVYLPRTTEVVHPAPPVRPARDVAGTETVLVVEDDEGIRKLVRMILSANGYSVLAATGPRDALRLSRDHDGEIDLLITDMVMPEMTGREVADRLSSERPGMRVLYMSGYTGDAMIHRGLLEPGAFFVVKPFTGVQLGESVRALLDHS